MDKSLKITLELEARDSNLSPEKVKVRKGQVIRNAEYTSVEKAAVGGSWKRFWQMFALVDYPTKCPFCGKNLNEDDIDGCHVNIQRQYMFREGTYFTSKKYIIPGHHDCNMQLGDEFSAEMDIYAVEAIEKE